jgi:hypothetical protein
LHAPASAGSVRLTSFVSITIVVISLSFSPSRGRHHSSIASQLPPDAGDSQHSKNTAVRFFDAAAAAVSGGAACCIGKLEPTGVVAFCVGALSAPGAADAAPVAELDVPDGGGIKALTGVIAAADACLRARALVLPAEEIQILPVSAYCNLS